MRRPFAKKKRSKNRGKFLLFLFISLFVFTLYKLDRDLRPVLMAVCDAQARSIATETINRTIKEEFGSKISYDDLMNVKIDKDGNVVMIQANTVELNRIGSQVALEAQKKIEEIGVKGIKIPIGVLFQNDLLAYYGPKVTFKMQPVGSAVTSYRSEFEAAGINQTRHIVYLDIKASIQVVIPLARNSISVTNNVPIAESIIIGKVPNTYANFGGELGEGSPKVYGVPKSQ
jgi:sporulation protein YunB